LVVVVVLVVVVEAIEEVVAAAVEVVNEFAVKVDAVSYDQTLF